MARIHHNAISVAVIRNDSLRIWNTATNAWVAYPTFGSYSVDTLLTLTFTAGDYNAEVPTGAANDWHSAVIFENSAPLFNDVADATVDNPFSSPVDADIVSDKRTWWASDTRATNVVTITDNTVATLSMQPDLNEATAIASVGSAVVGGVAGGNLKVTKDGRRANFDPAYPLTVGSYEVSVVVLTTDAQTIETMATLVVE